MGQTVTQSDLAAVSLNNGAAQSQPQPHSPAAVAGERLGCVKHLKHLLLLLVRDSRAVIRNLNNGEFSLPIPGNCNMGTLRRIF